MDDAFIAARLSVMLKDARKGHQLSQTALAAKSGVSQQAISAAELGLRTPSLSTFWALCEALDLDSERVRKRVSVTPHLAE